MIQKTRSFVFFLIIFLIPNQLGLHFWPKFSFINGIRVDYLSPTLYLLDILIILLFLLTLPDIKKTQIIPKNHYFWNLALFTVFVLIINLFFSASLSAHIFGLIKVVEFSFFGIYVYSFFNRKDILYLSETLALGGIFSSILSFFQFANQGSLGGIFYLAGERSFVSSTIGIALMNINGNSVLRPYSSFPHPNVFAFFLLLVLTISVSVFSFQKYLKDKIFFLITIFITSAALLLTFSRIVIFCMMLVYLVLFIKIIKKKFSNFVYSLPFIFALFLYATSFYSRFLNLNLLKRDFLFRIDLIDISFKIIRDNFFFGTGLNNFFLHEALFQKKVDASLLQPVHNIFLLAFAEVGVFGIIFLLFTLIYLIGLLIKKIQKEKGIEKNFHLGLLLLIVSIIIVGNFDHFFFTLEQGMLIFSLILGLSFNNLKVKESV